GDARGSPAASQGDRPAPQALDHGSPAQPARPPRVDGRVAPDAHEDAALPDGLRITIRRDRSSDLRDTSTQDIVEYREISSRQCVISVPDGRQHSVTMKFLVPAGSTPGLTWQWSLNAWDGGHYCVQRANLLRRSSPGHPRIATGVDDDESRPDRRGFEDLELDQEGDGNDRQYDLRQHHRRVVEGGQGRASGLRELPDPPPQLSKGPQSQDRIERRRPPETGAVLQGRKATARARQRLRRLQLV